MTVCSSVCSSTRYQGCSRNSHTTLSLWAWLGPMTVDNSEPLTIYARIDAISAAIDNRRQVGLSRSQDLCKREESSEAFAACGRACEQSRQCTRGWIRSRVF